MGLYVLRVISLGNEGRALMGIGSTQSVSRFEWDTSVRRRNVPNGGLQPPSSQDALYQFDHPMDLLGV